MDRTDPPRPEPPATPRTARDEGVLGWAAAVMLVLGLIGPSFGPALVPARAAFHVDLLTAGTLFLVLGLARTAGAFLAAVLSDLTGRRNLLAAYGALLLAGLVAVAAAPDWPVVLAGAAGIGFAFGAVSTEANAVTAVAGGAQRGRDLSLINAVYSVGATAGPLTVGALLLAHLSWRVAFALWADATLLPFWGLSAAAGRLGRNSGGRAASPPVRPGLRTLALAAMAFVYNGIGWTVGGWAATYLIGRFGAGLWAGAMGSGLFYALLTVGRLVNGGLAARVSPGRLLRWEAVSSAAALLSLALAPNPAAALAAFAVAGFFLAGIYPNLVACATGRHPDRPGAMAGMIATGGAIGVGVVPFTAGALSRGMGLTAMPWLLVGLGCALVVLGVVASDDGPAAAGDRRLRATP